MLPISEQYVRSPCEIKAMENVPILSGYIKGINDDGLVICGKTDDLPIIHCNTAVKVDIFNSILGFRVLVGVVFVSAKELLKVVDLQSVSDYEKRQFFRVRVEINTEVYKVDEETEDECREQRFPIKIRDLSLSGALFSSDSKYGLQLDDRICINLVLYEKKTAILAKIVRLIKNDVDGMDNFGCEFLDNTGRQFDMLSRYLFDCQREQIQFLKQNRI